MTVRWKLPPSEEKKSHLDAKNYLLEITSSGFEWLYLHHETIYNTGKSYRLSLADLIPMRECTYPNIHADMTADQYKKKYNVLPIMIFDVGLWSLKHEKIVAALEVSNGHWLKDSKKLKLGTAKIVSFEIAGRPKHWGPQKDRITAQGVIIPDKPLAVVEMWIAAKWKKF